MPDNSTRDSDKLPSVEVVNVSPALAEDWLSRNPKNRNLRRAVVDAYARDMEAGRWRMNGETSAPNAPTATRSN